ncbi:23 kDa integral membrane protein-like [Plodia interpunctella]|uniref:23 kDa integral membrane protein-like n=1 Tax=Plodia interpunctella TaxID=58824 RepID=UPI002368C52E|nr:23 kDa integral membrane protein-like [Plodia interpunctella]
MNCLKFIVKHLLFIFNLIFTLVALAIIGVGSYALHYVNHNDILANLTAAGDVTIAHDFSPSVLKFACISVIVLGCVVFLVSFCGCCGSISENKCLICSYAIIMLILAGGSILVVVIRSSYVDVADKLVKDYLHDIFYTPPYPIEDETINGLQFAIKCCGDYGSQFYNGTTLNVDEHVLEAIYDKLNITGIGLVSPSCCSTIDLRSFLDDPQNYLLDEFQCTIDDLYQEGCVPKVLDFVSVVEKYITIIFGVIAGVTVLSFILGFYMCCAIKPKHSKYDRY